MDYNNGQNEQNNSGIGIENVNSNTNPYTQTASDLTNQPSNMNNAYQEGDASNLYQTTDNTDQTADTVNAYETADTVNAYQTAGNYDSYDASFQSENVNYAYDPNQSYAGSQYDAYDELPEANKKDTQGIVAMCLGIASIAVMVVCCCVRGVAAPASLGLGIAAIITGIASRKKPTASGFGIAGIVTGSVGGAMGVFALISSILSLTLSTGSSLMKYMDLLNTTP